MPDNSFDVVSKIEIPEVLNAIQQALKEVHQRYDLKDSRSNIELVEKDRPGFWEANGYHMRGDPWTEERFGL